MNDTTKNISKYSATLPNLSKIHIEPGPQNVILFGNSVFVEKRVKRMSYWMKNGPESNDVVLKNEKREIFRHSQRETHRKVGHLRGWVRSDIAVRLPAAPRNQKQVKKTSARILRRSMALKVSSFQFSDPYNCEKINVVVLCHLTYNPLLCQT